MLSLKKNRDFQRVYHDGRSVADRNLVIYASENGLSGNRLGISASKKFGNSVKRHRFQRRIREICRHQEKDLVSGRDIVVIARSGASESGYHVLEESFVRLTGRLKVRNGK